MRQFLSIVVMLSAVSLGWPAHVPAQGCGGTPSSCEPALGPGVNGSRKNYSCCNFAGVNAACAVLNGTTFVEANLSFANITCFPNGVKLRGTDMQRANLSGTNLANADFGQGVNMTSAIVTPATILAGANLPRASLLDIDLRGVNCRGANFTSALMGNDPGGAFATLASGADFTEANLSRIVAPGTDFTGAIMRCATLTAADLPGANLTDVDATCDPNGIKIGTADLRGANLSGANFTEANFGSSDFTGAIVSPTTVFAGAVLTGSDFRNVDLSGVSFRAANLRAALMQDDPGGAFKTLLVGADLTEANLTVLVARGADFSDATLGCALLTGAELSGANLARTDITCDPDGVNFATADLRDADLTAANLTDANLTGTDFTGAKVSPETVLERATLQSAILRNVDLSGVNLRAASLNSAVLTDDPNGLFETRFVGADLSETDLRQVQARGVNLNGASLACALMTAAQLGTASLVGADLTCDPIGVQMNTADFRDADLSGAKLSRGNFTRANLQRANLAGADISDALFCHADLRESSIADAVFTSPPRYLFGTLFPEDFDPVAEGWAQCLCGNDRDCDDGDVCTGEELCDTETGQCFPGIPLFCGTEGETECLAAACDPFHGCLELRPVDDGQFCTRDRGCTFGECQAGECVESPQCDAFLVQVQVVLKRAGKAVPVTCLGERGDVCQAQGFYVPDADDETTDDESIRVVEIDPGPVTAAAKVDCFSVPKGARLTRNVKRKIKGNGRAKLKLKLNRVGKCLLNDAGDDGIGLRIRSILTPRNGAEPRPLEFQVRFIKRPVPSDDDDDSEN
jgi:uncharacterized protein YjbI with pentapeptide repeats